MALAVELRVQHDARYINLCNGQNQTLLYRDPCRAGKTVSKSKEIIEGRRNRHRAHWGLPLLAVFCFLAMMVHMQVFVL